jgi:hypothetical protein
MRLSTASADEMPALASDAKTTMRRIVNCCADTAALEHLAPEDAATVRDELASLGRALEAQITGIIEFRWAQLAGGGASLTGIEPMTKRRCKGRPLPSPPVLTGISFALFF